MSSRFVSAGGAEVKAPEGLSSATDEAWVKARDQVEKSKVPTKDVPAPGTQADGKSLYEHLQTQRALKQEAFEEAAKLKNQFRPLDESEVDFLEGVRRKQQAQATDVKQQTAEQLRAFREEQIAVQQINEDADHVETGVASTKIGANVWTSSKKRRRQHDAEDNGDSMKARKTAPISGDGTTLDAGTKSEQEPQPTRDLPPEQSHAREEAEISTPIVAKPMLNLAGYGSDSD